MVRDGRLIQLEARGEVADAHFVLSARERCKDRDARGIAERLKDRGFIAQVAVIDRRFWTAPLYRHISILIFESAFVNVADPVCSRPHGSSNEDRRIAHAQA